MTARIQRDFHLFKFELKGALLERQVIGNKLAERQVFFSATFVINLFRIIEYCAVFNEGASGKDNEVALVKCIYEKPKF